jgi:hypothetical protein
MSIHPVSLNPKNKTFGSDYDDVAKWYMEAIKNRQYKNAKDWLTRIVSEDQSLANLGEQ